MKRICTVVLLLVFGASAHGQRIKDLASVDGVRSNQLVGYGLVVGIVGTGELADANAAGWLTRFFLSPFMPF